MFPIRDENRPSKTPYITYSLLIINIVVFFFFLIQGTTKLMMGIRSWGAIPADIIAGRNLWTLFTSMFMHADILHLFGNMLYLWVFGDNVEDTLGHFKYLFFYFFGGLVATFTHIGSLFILLPNLENIGFSIPTVGASGAISAVLGAYIVLYPRAKIRTLAFYIFITVVTIPAYYYLGFWFLYQLIMGFFSLTGLSSGVAFWAHIGGFAAGLLIIKAFRFYPKFERTDVATQRPLKPLVVSPSVRKPFVDLMIEGDMIRVLAEIPGVEQKNIKISVSEIEVIISAKHETVSYYRRVHLPAAVDTQVYDFSFRNGVLSFSLHMAS
ncbi:MAG: rhomboid family intramembrane serine protease [Candidatus Bathyarchaeota archaeon]|jgi:membrane associated rhomboid family serine protease